MTLDISRAWQTAARLLRDNRTTLVALGGALFFLPYLVVLLAAPHLATPPAPGGTLRATMAALEAYYAQTWWLFTIALILFVYGTLAVLALLRGRERPTVAGALAIAGGALPTYLLALVLELTALNLVAMALLLVGSVTGSQAVQTLVFAAIVVLQFYGFARLALTAPVVVIEGERNPVRALRRSWALTRGSAGRILGMSALILVAFVVTTVVVAVIVGLLLQLLGDTFAAIGDALFSAGVTAALLTVLACVLAALHGALAGNAAAPPRG